MDAIDRQFFWEGDGSVIEGFQFWFTPEERFREGDLIMYSTDGKVPVKLLSKDNGNWPRVIMTNIPFLLAIYPFSIVPFPFSIVPFLALCYVNLIMR